MKAKKPGKRLPPESGEPPPSNRRILHLPLRAKHLREQETAKPARFITRAPRNARRAKRQT